MNTKSILIFILLFSSLGCAAGDQQRLDNAKNFYTSTVRVVTLLINTGYLAKDDQAMKDTIWKASEAVNAAFEKSQAYLTAGQKLDGNFWLDQGLSALEVLLTYKSQGETKHRASNPTTRPTLPGVSYGPSNLNRGYWHCPFAGLEYTRGGANRAAAGVT